MAGRSCRFAACVVSACLLAMVLAACGNGQHPEPNPSTANSQVAASQAALEETVVRLTAPGCSAAVGERGQVIWNGVAGLAQTDPKVRITADTSFEIASVSKQFTAAAVLLLDAAGRLSLTDPVAMYVPGLPSWSRRITVDELIHHTSGIPDFIGRLRAMGYDFVDRVDHKTVLATIASSRRLDFAPGSSWEYSNSNYILLGEVVAKASGKPLADYLQQSIFDPLGLAMVGNSPGQIAGRAHSYHGVLNTMGWEISDSRWEVLGPAGIQATPSDLVRWADNYRTGAVGGASLLKAQVANAVDSKIDGKSYGAGIVVEPGGSLWHNGEWGAFHTVFTISPDRSKAIAIACNRRTSTPRSCPISWRASGSRANGRQRVRQDAIGATDVAAACELPVPARCPRTNPPQGLS